MTETKLINCRKSNLVNLGYRDLVHWLEDDEHIYIGREMEFYVKGAKGSKWRNPYSVKKYGRDECLQRYRQNIKNSPELLHSLEELRGKTLACWCAPLPCHGDILIELLDKS